MSSAQSLEASYRQVAELYDMADELIATVLASPKDQQEMHFRVVNPLVEQLEESADVLTQEFINIAEGKAKQSQVPRKRIEASLRKIYMEMSAYKKLVDQVRKPMFDAITKLVSPVVSKVKRHVEKVVAVFVGMINISLERVMQKTDIDNLKQHEEKVANMLHQMAHGKAT